MCANNRQGKTSQITDGRHFQWCWSALSNMLHKCPFDESIRIANVKFAVLMKGDFVVVDKYDDEVSR